MQNHDEHGRMDESRDHGADQSEEGRMARMKERTRETIDRAKEGLSAGAATASEKGREVLGGVRHQAGKAAEIVRTSESDEHLRENVAHKTESGLDRAGDALTRAAPSIGRGTEKAAEKLGQALHAVSHPTAVLLGTIAGTLGGWWNTAAEKRLDMPEQEDRNCQEHFNRIAAPPPGMTYERARPAYAVGYVAGQNPAYRGRQFDELESELRTGFGEDRREEFDSLREFTRYGYERANTRDVSRDV